MKRTLFALLFALALVGALLIAMPMTGSAAGNPNPTVLPPNSHPFGLTYAQWAVKWWQWVLAQPIPTNPNLDLTGQYCGIGQSGPVWFLAGTFGQTADRTCKVPAGKALFFPVANWAYIGFPWDPSDTALVAQQNCKAGIDGLKDYGALVDGVQIRNLSLYRLYHGELNSLPVFNATLPDNNIIGQPAGSYGPNSTDGYYLMLAPLTPGKHEVEFYAKEFGVEVTYHLTVQ